MKKLVALVLAAMLLTTGCSTKAPEAAGGMKAGTYKASAAGFHGDITLEVTVDAEKITDIQVIEHSETEGIGAAALPELVTKVLDSQSIGIDGVSGATVTSNGFKAAMEDALTQAGADMDKMTKSAESSSATKEEVTRKLLFFCVAGIWILFLAVEFFIVRAMRPGRKKNCRYLIVLGAQVRGERITDSLKRRLDAALLYHQVCSSVKIIVSGGQGKGEDVSEAYAMAQYLREHGVKDEQIMLEDQSRTTRENLRFSKAYLEELKTPVGIVTNNFHLFRALLIGRSEGYENLTGIAAGCNRILFLNYMVREFFAVVWLWIQRGKKKSG